MTSTVLGSARCPEAQQRLVEAAELPGRAQPHPPPAGLDLARATPRCGSARCVRDHLEAAVASWTGDRMSFPGETARAGARGACSSGGKCRGGSPLPAGRSLVGHVASTGRRRGLHDRPDLPPLVGWFRPSCPATLAGWARPGTPRRRGGRCRTVPPAGHGEAAVCVARGGSVTRSLPAPQPATYSSTGRRCPAGPLPELRTGGWW